MSAETKISELLCKTFESIKDREIYFSCTVEEYDRFVHGINQLHNEEKLTNQNKYFKQKLEKLK